MKYIDNFLNGITMYRLMLYGLTALAIVAVIFGFTGILSYSGLSLLSSFFILALTCFIANQILAKIFNVQTNVESEWITGFILFFIIYPPEGLKDISVLLIAGALAMLSKYILVWKKKHIFNPAATAVFLLGLFGSGMAGWWVGSEVMLIPVLILGFLVLRKLQRFTLFFSFLIAGCVSIAVVSLHHGLDLLQISKQIFTSWPILFLGSIMLTEPLTTPPTRKLQIFYGILVGLLFGAQFHFGPLYASPALALLLGNIFSFIVSPRARLVLRLEKKEKITPDIYNFVFTPDEKLVFKPGQYLEWTLGHKGSDTRGNRRYFTIASSPTEKNIILGTKFYPKPSTFKQKLLSLETGSTIIASQLSGEFTMPDNKNKKLVFIAGGIGITPFRSMAKYMIDAQEKRDIVMLYSSKTLADIAYKDIFDTAGQVGWKNIYVVNETGGQNPTFPAQVGFITKEMLMKEIPDYKERMYFISGTHAMVSNFEQVLRKLNIHESHIRTDFFPGFA